MVQRGLVALTTRLCPGTVVLQRKRWISSDERVAERISAVL
jgi:hypothetical protein